MLVGHVFDFALILRSRRRDLRLRQSDLAKKAGVSRGFIVALEHGKPSLDFGKVLKILEVMNVPMSLGWNEEPPDWTKPIIKRVMARERGWAETRPRSWRQKVRPAPKPPQDWFLHADERMIQTAKRDAAERWAREQTLKYPQEVLEVRRRLAAVIKGRGGQTRANNPQASANSHVAEQLDCWTERTTHGLQH